jgi:DNA modification methylase
MTRVQSDSKATENLQWDGQLKNGSMWTVYCGDARKILKDVPSEIFDCVVTSPPYYWLRDYEVEEQIGLENTVEGYVAAVHGVMEEVVRVLRSSGLLFLNLGDTYYSGKGKSHGTDPKSSRRRFGLRAVDKSGGLDVNAKPKSALGIPWRVAMRMCENGWVLRSPIVWHRKHCLPESVKDRPRRSYEYVFMFAKNRKYFFERQPLIDVDEEDMWSIVARHRSPNGLGTAPFPDELVQRCLEIGCPAKGMVLDPFAGSGTTLRVALKSGRSAKGIDLNRTFCDHIVEELKRME